MPTYGLAGKTALVTGAARGIGLETVRLLHRRGAAVALLDLDAAAVEAGAGEMGGSALAIAADVTDRAAMEDAVERTVERFGSLDVVVANAGVAPTPATMRAIDPDAFERVVEIDLLGVWRTVRPALGPISAGGGHVVVVSSIYAWLNGALAGSYAVSKAGVEQLGRALRMELAPAGASATVAHFGFVDTAMVRETFSHPVAHGFEQLFPRWARRRMTAAQAAEALVAGIERRAPRVIAPAWLKGWFALRGVVNPLLDRAMARDRRVLELVRQADAERASFSRARRADA
jgi:NAD(P)-dependent dehydrogenase (short-subunit alcohol dehydrogenase family)